MGQEYVRIPTVTPTLPVFSRFWKNLPWMERLFFSLPPPPLLTLPVERSQPIENNKVRNLTLMKEMRKRKHCPSAHLCRVERKGRLRSRRQRVETDFVSLCCLHVRLSGSVLVRMPAYVYVCVCVLGGRARVHSCVSDRRAAAAAVEDDCATARFV